jgi:ureidoacrylate peracid hydrolase
MPNLTASAPLAASRKVLINAKPGPISFQTTEAAVIVVDMQNDFSSEGGLFHRAGIDISPIQATLEPASRVLAAARQEGLKIIYLKMAFQPDLSDAGPPGSPNHDRHIRFGAGTTVLAPDGTDTRVLIRDTWGTSVISDLAPEPTDLQIYKHRFSGFYQTDLDAILRQLGVKYLIVVGCTTSICVESTIRDAMFRNYSCVLLDDCCAEPLGQEFSRSNHEASLLLIETLFGWVSQSEAFVDAVAPSPSTP